MDYIPNGNTLFPSARLRTDTSAHTVEDMTARFKYFKDGVLYYLGESGKEYPIRPPKGEKMYALEDEKDLQSRFKTNKDSE